MNNTHLAGLEHERAIVLIRKRQVVCTQIGQQADSLGHLHAVAQGRCVRNIKKKIMQARQVTSLSAAREGR